MPNKYTNEDKYTKIIIRKFWITPLLFACIFSTVISTAILMNGIEMSISWQHMLLTVIPIGGVLMILPEVEYWEYRPWQGAPQRSEAELIDD